MHQNCLICVGGNLPTSGASVLDAAQSAVAEIGAFPGRILSVSRWFRTPAFPAGSGPDFVNGALSIESALTPEALLTRLHEVEARFGRVRDVRWGPRTLDLDLIAVGDMVLPDRPRWQRWHDLELDRQVIEKPEEIILPHPRMHERSFVLVPLMDVAPDWRHPVLGRTVAEMHGDLTAEARQSVVPLEDPACQ